MKATFQDTANFDNNCVAPPEMYRRGYNFRHRFLFLLKFASIAVEENDEAGSREAKKWLISSFLLLKVTMATISSQKETNHLIF